MKKSFIFIFLSIALCLSLALLPSPMRVARALDSYTIRYYLDDGKTDLYDEQTVQSGDYATVPVTPLKEGYVFISWQNGSERFSFKNTQIDRDIDLVANWYKLGEDVVVSQMFSVKFNVNGVIVNEQFVKNGEDATAPIKFAMPNGKEFVRWDGDYTNVGQDIVIEAVLEDAEYKVEVIGFDGESVHTFNGIKYGEALDLSKVNVPSIAHYHVDSKEPYIGETQCVTTDGTIYINYVPDVYSVVFSVNDEEYNRQSIKYGQYVSFPAIVEKVGYIFQGWFDSKTNRAFDFNTFIEDDTSLYAKYEIIENKKYDVTFYNDGIQYGAVQRIEEGKSAIMAGSPTREGYEFLGWFVTGETKMPYDFSTPVTSDLSLNAMFRIKGYTVTVMSDGEVISTQEVKYGGNAIEPEVKVKDGYIFTGFDASFKDIRKDMVINATFRLKTFAVMFIDNMGKKMCATQYIEYGKSAKAPKFEVPEGNVFVGWSEDYENVVDDIVVIPLFEKIKLSVSYYLDGQKLSDENIDYGSFATNLFPELDENSLFSGWHIDENFESGYVFTTPVKANLELYGYTYAKPVDKYTVTFKIDGSIYAIYPVESGSACPTPTSPDKYGYNFVGWDKDFSVIVSDMEINAIFTAKEYNVSFRGYDGDDKDNIKVTFGSLITENMLPKTTPQKTGYTFISWDWDFTRPVSSDITIYALFNINTYSVTFMLSDEVYEVQYVAYGSYPMIPNQPIVSGKQFIGWYVEEDGEKVAFSFRNSVEKDVVTYAKFTAVKRYVYYYLDDKPYAEDSFEVGSKIVKHAEPELDDNMTFNGWTGLPEDMIMPNNILNVYGYTHRMYAVKYYIDGELYTQRSYYDGDAVLKMDAPQTDEDIIFVEWLGEIDVMPKEDVIVNASVKHRYMLSYSIDGKVYYEYKLLEGSNVEPYIFEGKIDGIVFNGWTNEPSVMPNAPFTVIASIVKLNKYTLTYMIDDDRVLTQFEIYETYPVSPLGYGLDTDRYGIDGVFDGWIGEVEAMPSHDVVVTPNIHYYRNINYFIADREYRTVRVLEGDTIKALPEPSSEDLNDYEIFKGWLNVPSIMPDNDIRIDADLQILRLFTIYYYIDDELYTTRIYYETKAVFPLDAPTTDIYGKVFVRWADEPSVMPSGNVSVYAECRDKERHTITYYINGEVYDTVEYFVGETVAKMPEPKELDESIVFKGWLSEIDIMPDEDISIYADIEIIETRDNVFSLELISRVDDEVVYVLKVSGKVNLAGFMGKIEFNSGAIKNIEAEHDEYVTAGLVDDEYRFIWTVGDNVNEGTTFITFTITYSSKDIQGGVSLDISEVYAFTTDGNIIPVEFATK